MRTAIMFGRTNVDISLSQGPSVLDDNRHFPYVRIPHYCAGRVSERSDKLFHNACMTLKYVFISSIYCFNKFMFLQRF